MFTNHVSTMKNCSSVNFYGYSIAVAELSGRRFGPDSANHPENWSEDRYQQDP